MKFIYWNNNVNPRVVIFEVEADNILIADKELEKETGFNPTKCVWIGCSIGKLKDK